MNKAAPFRASLLTAPGMLFLWVLTGFCELLPEVSLPVCSTPPVLDGRLDDACWKEASRLSGLHPLRSDKPEPGEPTRALVTRDEAWLYLGFHCPNPSMEQVSAIWKQHDESVHQDDSIEVFLDPGTDGALYVHFALSFANVRAEQRVVGKETERSWDVPWRSATHVTDVGWTGETAIPLFVLAGHGDMDGARLNITRNKVIFGHDAIGEKTRRRLTWLTWAPLLRSFHEPERFGHLRGLAAAPIRTPFLPAIVEAEVGPYTLHDGQQIYRVKGSIRNHSVTAGRVRLQVRDIPAQGAPRDVMVDVTLGAMEHREFAAAMPVTNLLQRTVAILLRDPTSGQVLQDYTVPSTGILSAMAQPLNDRNYYTTEPQARIRCGLGLPEEGLKGHVLVVRDSNGKLLSTTRPVVPETLVTVPLADMPVGRHALVLALEQADGRPVARREVLLRKRTPQPGNEVKIDLFNRVVLKDGEPCFPFGMFCGRGGDHFRLLAENGFNTVVLWSWYSGPEAGKAAAEAARQHDLLVIDRYWNYIGKRKSIKEGIGDIAEAVEAVGNCPNLLAYFSVDEPNLAARYGGSFDAVMQDCRLLYRTILEHDGYHPVCMLYARYIPPAATATAWADILAFDTYLPGGFDDINSTPAAMARDTARLEQRAAADGHVTWVVPLAETLGAGRSARGLLPAEHRAQAYLAVINGARGLVYFQYSVFSHVKSWNVLSELADHVNELAPAILAAPVPHEVRYEPGPCDPANGVITDVQVRLFKAADGPYTLLAANHRDVPAAATFHVSALAKDRNVTRRFGNDVYRVDKGSFSDLFEPYGVRAYVLPLATPAPGPLAIEVRCEALPRTEPPEPRTGSMVRLGKRNAMPNPSLERATLSGMPDHVFPIRLEGRPAVGEPGALFALDTDSPYHGKACLRITYHGLANMPSCLGAHMAAYPPLLDAPTHYVLSLYMRSDTEGAHVNVTVNGMSPGKATFALTKGWQRYSLGGMLQVTRRRVRSVSVVPVGEGTTVWVDAMQFEAGAQPTEFTLE